MNTKAIREFTENKIQSGQSHQEILEELLPLSGKDKAQLVKILRSVPSLGARARYGAHNHLLMVLLAISALLKLWVGIVILQQTGAAFSPIVMLMPVVNLVLLWGVFKFSPGAHLVVGILSLLGLLRSISAPEPDAAMFFEVGLLAVMALLSLYLHKKFTNIVFSND